MFTSDHLAISAIQSPNSAAGAHIDVMNAFCFKLVCAANVVNVIRVSAVDNNVVCLYKFNQLMENSIDKSGRDHQPDRTRRLKLLDKGAERGIAGGAFVYKCLHCIRATIVHDAFVPAVQKASHHVGAHASQSNHSNLHSKLPCEVLLFT